MEVTVSRATWFRGQGKDGTILSALLTNNGKRCCLGFFAQQCGIPDKALKLSIPDRRTGHEDRIYAAGPENIESEEEKAKFPDNFWAEDNKKENAHWILTAMQRNDVKEGSEADREEMLTRVFADNGHSIKFVD